MNESQQKHEKDLDTKLALENRSGEIRMEHRIRET